MIYERPEGKGFCIIKKSCAANMDGERGILVWDYFIFNEITFVSDGSKNVKSLFCSWSDAKTEKTFNDLCKIYQITDKSDRKKDLNEDQKLSENESLPVDLSKITLAGLEAMENQESVCINIRYAGNLIGYMNYRFKAYGEIDKRALLFDAVIETNYRGKHIFSHVIKQLANMYPISISVKNFPEEYKDMAKHLITFNNVSAEA